ncbi:ferritin [Candidatus Borrarchaeum sp.]|uniref:ferritin n=1 Tax=Candidatus Borrarchaeum sp. TaxID=2846742 RepID=UPI00257AA49B|nr:ferritin [Candidatus Borrarchaeum sp.]
MTLSDTMRDSLNDQVKWELWSGYYYLSMATYFYEKNLPGFAKYWTVHAAEEQEHAMKIFKHIVERGGRVTLQTIEQPQTDWNSPLHVAEEVVEHERKVTGMINNLVTMAKSENDYATEVFLQWFIDEQVEEEEGAEKVYNQVKLAGDSGTALLMLDIEFAKKAAAKEED